MRAGPCHMNRSSPDRQRRGSFLGENTARGENLSGKMHLGTQSWHVWLRLWWGEEEVGQGSRDVRNLGGHGGSGSHGWFVKDENGNELICGTHTPTL